ncbi:MAG: glycosyltransferase [Desulfuromonas sp.]|nr:MAG: glycosyltransferase [Desulfuromonas sp.]
MHQDNRPWVLQLCHGYSGPFLDCARQYAALFKDSPFRVCTVYLTGEEREQVRVDSQSDEVIFLNYTSQQIRGLKLSAIRAVRNLLAKRATSFIIAHRFKPIYIALLASRLPVIGIHHAFGVYQRRSRRFFVQCFKQRLTLLAVSNAVRDEIRDDLPGWPVDQIETLYNRIDVTALQQEHFSAHDARKALDLPADAWIVGNVGRLHPDKDQDTLIRGFAAARPALPDNSLLVIMGSGKLETSLKQLAVELNISEHVIFLGQVPQGRRYFKAFNVFALTSDHEPFGMVLLEAMSADLPVICSDCGGGREVVSGCGTLFPLGDGAALAEKLVALHNSDQNQSLTSIRERLAMFSDDTVRRQFWNLKRIAALLDKETDHV